MIDTNVGGAGVKVREFAESAVEWGAFVLVAIALAIWATGCSAERLALEERWRPLEAVVEVEQLPTDRGQSVTVVPDVWVSDLDAWTAAYPEGVERDALLAHEREHAVRQLDAGRALWVARYLSDTRFAWKEEQRGWALELRARQAGGRLAPPEAYAVVLSRYRVPAGKLVSYADALVFVRSVLNGTWTPD